MREKENASRAVGKKNYSVIRVIRDRFNPERVKRGENDS